MPIENREIKSGVFADLFGDDEKDGKKNFLALYNAILPAKARYKESLYKIPAPEFYVFYNGEKEAEKECILKLSDAFLERQDLPMCEAKVKFTNIRGKEGEKKAKTCPSFRSVISLNSTVSLWKLFSDIRPS